MIPETMKAVVLTGPSRLGAGQGEGFWNESFGADPQAGRDPGRLYPEAVNPRH